MAFILSPNMNLPVPSVGSEAGPQYAQDVNNSLALLDQHDHSPGKGVQITPAGLNINSALTLNSNFLVSVAGLSLIAQSVLPANSTVYESGVDLFFVDGLGNNIQLTANGGIAGTSGSIANLTAPASVTYVSASKTFVFQSNASIAANLDAASVLLRNISPNSTNAITLQAPAALATSYSITMPALPTSLSLVALDASGNLSAPYSISGGLNASVLTDNTITTSKLVDNIITTPKIVDGAVTQEKRAPLGQQISSGLVGAFTESAQIYTQVPGLSVTITTTGRLVFMGLIATGLSPDASALIPFNNEGGVGFYRNGVQLCNQAIDARTTVSSANYFDIPSAGTYTYSVGIITSGNNMTITNCKLIVYEL